MLLSITLLGVGTGLPPANNPRVDEEQDALCIVEPVEVSPKSVPFPVDEIVMNSIVLEAIGEPGEVIMYSPLVVEEQAAEFHPAAVESPKSIAFPSVEIVM
jgi:hypothetical protein